MAFSLVGLLLLSVAATFQMLLVAAGLMGIGSSIFHPESSRVARMASGGRHGLAQSLFQVGGNVGSSFGPLLGAFVVVPRGQSSIVWCSLLALVAIVVLWRIGGWYRIHQSPTVGRAAHRSSSHQRATLSSRRVAWSLAILAALIFSKYFYLASLSSYYTFYLISRFHVSIRTAQLDLFVFLGAVAAGTILGGPIGDRFGRKKVIWGSIFGVFPFTLLAAARESALDLDTQRADRPHSGLGVLGHRGLRAGTGAGPGGADLGRLLRLCVRDGRARGGGAGPRWPMSSASSRCITCARSSR